MARQPYTALRKRVRVPYVGLVRVFVLVDAYNCVPDEQPVRAVDGGPADRCIRWFGPFDAPVQM